MKRSEVCLNTCLDKTFAQDRIIAVVFDYIAFGASDMFTGAIL